MKEPVVVPFARVAFPREEEVFTMRVPTFKLPVLVAFVKTVLPRELEVFTVSTVIVVVAREEVPVTEKVWVEELKVICVAPPKVPPLLYCNWVLEPAAEVLPPQSEPVPETTPFTSRKHWVPESDAIVRLVVVAVPELKRFVEVTDVTAIVVPVAVVKVIPWRTAVPFTVRVPPIKALLVTESAVPAPVTPNVVPVPFTNVAFPSEEDVFTERTVIVVVVKVPCPTLSILVIPFVVRLPAARFKFP